MEKIDIVSHSETFIYCLPNTSFSPSSIITPSGENFRVKSYKPFSTSTFLYTEFPWTLGEKMIHGKEYLTERILVYPSPEMDFVRLCILHLLGEHTNAMNRHGTEYIPFYPDLIYTSPVYWNAENKSQILLPKKALILRALWQN